MFSQSTTRIHETDFCARVAAWSAEFFAAADSPFHVTGIEGYGTGALTRKRKDIVFYDRSSGRVAICGEVRMPGSAKGHNAFDADLIQDASIKADNAGAQYFFTWDVNRFVLWDRARWREPLLDRRIRQWTLGPPSLKDPGEVGRPETLQRIRTQFLPAILVELGRIYRGESEEWPMPPDDIFINSLESYLSWPIDSTRTFLATETQRSGEFEQKLLNWMVEQDWSVARKDEEGWQQALDRAVETLVHLLANRLIFYQALRARFTSLPRIQLRGTPTSSQAYAALKRLFEKAIEASGDYEPLFYPHEQDWAGRLVFEGSGAALAWRRALRGIETYDFSSIASDVVGKVFQRLVSPEERHKWGQHFTDDNAVDLINAFCIRDGRAAVLDPACGSGSFLVRAYYRKRWLDPDQSHLEALSHLFGCDVALYPAHLATLNLAAREINHEANYPRIARRDFFDLEAAGPFCEIPPDKTKISLPILDAVVGNPPYVRQERIDPSEKKKIAELIAQRWHGLQLTGRADLHCYFWPAAAAMLKPNGYFGFLTSSSWLDVEYGFALQKWILSNFKLVAVMESESEPWFEDARVKTCATILRRCNESVERMATLVKFVRFKRPLASIIGQPSDRGTDRFRAVDVLRDFVESAEGDFEDESLRISVKHQEDLWKEGLRAGRVLRAVPTDLEESEPESSDHRNAGGTKGNMSGGGDGPQTSTIEDYVAGKWGRYLRAPSIYFDVMSRFGSKFVPLGEFASIRFGVKSGCDAFFMPRNITAEALERFPSSRDFKRRYHGVDRDPVVGGEVMIVRAGEGSEHPIEAEYLQPEVHSLMAIKRPVVRISDVDRVVLMVNKSEQELKGTYVGRYLAFGRRATFDSSKSKVVPVPQRATCAARERWYDLTNQVRPGFAFWSKAQQYRHIIAFNPDGLVCNCNLYDISWEESDERSQTVLTAIMNSTVVALWKTFYGRFAGTEGNLKTEVIDVNLLEVPDPRAINPRLADRLVRVFESLQMRTAGHLVEEQLMECHSPDRAQRIAAGPIVLPEELRQSDRRELDDAVFEMLGVTDGADRIALVDRLYLETAQHFRRIRVVEIQKMVQRSKSKSRRISSAELAADAWEATYLREEQSVARWLALLSEPRVELQIPATGVPRLVSPDPMFDREIVFFGKDRQAARIVCSSREQAELAKRLAELGFHGEVELPVDSDRCAGTLGELENRLTAARIEFETLASSRIADKKKRSEIVEVLLEWLVHGKPSKLSAEEISPAEEAEEAEEIASD